MDFFSKLGKKASKAYGATAEKTSKIAKEAKLKMKMNENKSDIKDLYIQIGKKVYEKHVREENIDINTELEEECTKIDVLSAEIETCLKSILELKDQKVCPKCNSKIDKSDAFCPRCGEKQQDGESCEEVEKAKEPEVILEELETVEIKPENEAEKEIVKEELQQEIKENEEENIDGEKKEKKKEEKLNENSSTES